MKTHYPKRFQRYLKTLQEASSNDWVRYSTTLLKAATVGVWGNGTIFSSIQDLATTNTHIYTNDGTSGAFAERAGMAGLRIVFGHY